VRHELAAIRTTTFHRILTRRGITLIIPLEGVMCAPRDIKDRLGGHIDGLTWDWQVGGGWVRG
jgi:hypothetical protein